MKNIGNGKVEKDNESTFGFNPRYAFNVSRKSPSSPWVLTNLILSSDSADRVQIDQRLKEYLNCATCAVMLDSDPLSEIIHKPEFQVAQCRKVQRDGAELVEVAFSYNSMDGQWKRSLKGKLLFEPDRYWCLRSGDIQVTGDFVSGTQMFRVTQSDNADKALPLSRVYESDGNWVTSSGDKNHQRIRYETTLSQTTRLPADSEFTLSAFDLPEPPGFENKSMPLYLWFGLAGIACLVLATYFRYKKGRASAKVE